MFDTEDLKIRVGKFINDKQEFKVNQEVVIYINDIYKTKERVSNEMSQDLIKGEIVLFGDERIHLDVIKVELWHVYCVAKNSYLVKSNKRINLPRTKFSMPFLLKKDVNDIKYEIKRGVDCIAASFVNSKDDILAIRNS